LEGNSDISLSRFELVIHQSYHVACGILLARRDGVPETSFAGGGLPPGMFHGSVDLVLVGLVVSILLFFFFVFLFVRRTATAFKEGMKGE
jgi:hypothetical protein